jgi:methionine-rich copper-binding protein CopC
VLNAPVRPSIRLFPTLLLALLGGLVLLVGPGVGAASAHAELLGTTPGAGSVLSRAPTAVVLTFDEPVQPQGATIVVTAPDGSRVAAGAAVLAGNKVRSSIPSRPAAGTYTVAYRVVSDDGHPVEGQFSFAARAPATQRAAGASAVVPLAAIDDQGSWLAANAAIIALGVAAAAVGLGLLVRERRQRG